jgi:stage IV sporulation protein FB
MDQNEANESIDDNGGDGFPPKPEIPEQPYFGPALLSLLLFVAAFYIFFDHSIKQIIILVAVLFIHELGHFLAMKYFGYSEVKMFFIPFLGALVSGNKEEISQKQRAIILLAGPVPGIIIGAILYFIGDATNNYDLLIIAGMFVFLNAFNLIPLTPLDGGRLVETLFFNNRETMNNIFIGISAAAMTFIAMRYKMYTLLILPFAFLMSIRQNKLMKELKDKLDALGLDYNKSYNSLTNREYWLIREKVVEKIPGFQNVDGAVYEPSPKERQIVQQVKNLAERKVITDLKPGGIIAFTITWLVFLAVPGIVLAIAMEEKM